MGAEAILEKIRKNAEEEAAALAKQGEEKAEAAAGKIRADAEAEAAAILGNARQRAEELEKRERLMAGLQIRKNTLAARRAVMDEAFSLAGEQLADLPKERWEALITRLLLEAAETGAEIMEVPAADREKYEWTPEGNLPIIGEKSFFKRLNAALKESAGSGLWGRFTTWTRPLTLCSPRPGRTGSRKFTGFCIPKTSKKGVGRWQQSAIPLP